MSRFPSIVIFLALAQFARCHVVTSFNPEDERNYIITPKDLAVTEKKLEVNASPVSTASVASVNTVNNTVEATSTEKCAKVGEFCMNHKDCCSNACLGFLKRCVSGKGQLVAGADVMDETED